MSAITQTEHGEAFHDGMEAAYANLTGLLDRLHAVDLHLVVWMEGNEVVISVDGDGLFSLRGEEDEEAFVEGSTFRTLRVDEALGGLEAWCNERLPTGHEVAT